MAYLNDAILDAALAILDTDATALHICSQEPTTYAEATDTYSLGSKSSLSVGAPGNRTPNGRKVTVAAITDGAVTDTDDATHWAIVDDANDLLLATGALSAPQAVTSGNPFTLAAFDIGIPDAA